MPLQPETLTFLADLEKHNDRDWFQQQKPRYEAARNDVVQLADAIMTGWAKEEAIPPQEPKKTLFRIYRDVRFSKNKDPYKPWLSFYLKRGPGRVGLFMQIRPGDRTMVGTGIYDPDPKQLAALRQEIDYNAGGLRKILAAKRFRDTWGELLGSKLKRAPKGYDPEDPNIDLLNHKQLYIMREIPDAACTGKGLEADILKIFRTAKPFMAYLDAPITELLTAKK